MRACDPVLAKEMKIKNFNFWESPLRGIYVYLFFYCIGFIFLFLSFKNTLYILDTTPLPRCVIYKYFLSVVTYFFILFNGFLQSNILQFWQIPINHCFLSWIMLL